MERIVGVGCDLLDRKRLESLTPGDPFWEKTFTEAERAQIQNTAEPLAHYASHFAGKEAVMKAIHADPNVLRWHEIEILNDAQGRPLVRLSGSAQQAALVRGAGEVQLSLSWETDYALAFAVVERAEE